MNIDISIEIPSLPSGWKGTPDELLEFLAVNGVFQIEGQTPAIQIGGARPTQDVGIWFSEHSVERYLNGKYRPISDVPIGSVLIFAGTALTPPENYLFCTSQSLPRADYPELFDAIGDTYNDPTDGGTTFRVPDYRGRGPVGSGMDSQSAAGDYAKQGITGRMREVVLGQYSGFEWPRNTGKPPGGYTKANAINGADYVFGVQAITEVFPPRIGQQFIIRFR